MRPLGLPEQIYLRHKDGESIGPLPLRALEVLFDSRVVDEGTPVSESGVTFKALRDFPELFHRVNEVKTMLVEGRDPWNGDATLDIPSTPAPSPPAPVAKKLETDRPLQAMLRAAIDKATGVLELKSQSGVLRLTYKDGKIVAVETTIHELSLAHYLVANGVCTDEQVHEGQQRAPSMGGDLGGALISLGIVQPHTYFEKLVAWAKHAIASAAAHGYERAVLTPKEVPNPPVPLGFDKLGVLADAVREGADRTFLQEKLLHKRPCALIPSQVEGAKIEDMKLKASELRVINHVNGARSLGEILDQLGGNETKSLEILRVVHFAQQTGFIVFGEDPELGKEVQQAAKVRETLERMKKQTYFEVLQINEKSSDEDTRTRYADLAKQYHPDKLRPGAAPELIEARRELFALINEAFEQMQTEKLRYEYANDLAQGKIGSADEMAKVQAVLQAETLFKKGEILAKMKKYDEALQHIDEAISLKPDDTEFKIFRAYYGYLQGARSGQDIEAAEKTIKAILGLLKNDANIASGYMFLGQLCKVVNKPQVAVKYFEKVLEYDDRNQEAMREVRLAKMREDKEKKKKWF